MFGVNINNLFCNGQIKMCLVCHFPIESTDIFIHLFRNKQKICDKLPTIGRQWNASIAASSFCRRHCANFISISINLFQYWPLICVGFAVGKTVMRYLLNSHVCNCDCNENAWHVVVRVWQTVISVFGQSEL